MPSDSADPDRALWFTDSGIALGARLTLKMLRRFGSRYVPVVNVPRLIVIVCLQKTVVGGKTSVMKTP
jgi:hypothetical protein